MWLSIVPRSYFHLWNARIPLFSAFRLVHFFAQSDPFFYYITHIHSIIIPISSHSLGWNAPDHQNLFLFIPFPFVPAASCALLKFALEKGIVVISFPCVCMSVLQVASLREPLKVETNDKAMKFVAIMWSAIRPPVAPLTSKTLASKAVRLISVYKKLECILRCWDFQRYSSDSRGKWSAVKRKYTISNQLRYTTPVPYILLFFPDIWEWLLTPAWVRNTYQEDLSAAVSSSFIFKYVNYCLWNKEHIELICSLSY